MPITLTYFNARGIAETCRLILHYAGEKFEDKRFEFDEFQKVKDQYPNGQLPLLEYDGKKLSQSIAISHLLALRHNLAGKTDFEKAQCLSIYAYMYDRGREIGPYFRACMFNSPEKQKHYEESYLPNIDKLLKTYEGYATANSNGFVLESGVSYADFMIASQLTTIFGLDAKKAQEYPKLKSYTDKIHALPQIADYVKNRPKTIV